MKWTVGTKISMAFTAILMFVIIFGVLANISMRELITSGEWRHHSYQVLNTLNQLFICQQIKLIKKNIVLINNIMTNSY